MVITKAKLITIPVGELVAMLSRAINTLEPVHTPEWAKQLTYPFGLVEGMNPEDPVVLIFAKPE
jgi:hypothetical protein